jgi:hypothetical protein
VVCGLIRVGWLGDSSGDTPIDFRFYGFHCGTIRLYAYHVIISFDFEPRLVKAIGTWSF